MLENEIVVFPCGIFYNVYDADVTFIDINNYQEFDEIDLGIVSKSDLFDFKETFSDSEVSLLITPTIQLSNFDEVNNYLFNSNITNTNN